MLYRWLINPSLSLSSTLFYTLYSTLTNTLHEDYTQTITNKQTMSSAGLSNVGHGAFYSDGDQRTAPRSEQNDRPKFEEGQTQSHQNLDSSMSCPVLMWNHYVKVNANKVEDQRSIGNRLAAQENSSNPDKPSASRYNPEAELSKKNPEAPVCLQPLVNTLG